MTQDTSKLAVIFTPDGDGAQASRVITQVGIASGALSCIVPLTEGVGHWQPLTLLLYVCLSILFLVTVYAGMGPLESLPYAWAKWLCQRFWTYILATGVLYLALQTISGEPYLQPIGFVVPLVPAAIVYTARRFLAVAAFYLGLMALGTLLHGTDYPGALVLSLIGYGALAALVFAFGRLLVEHALARQKAAGLANDLAHERDVLARLVEVTATLTRDLDLVQVLEQVAADGRTLAQAGQVRVWLQEDSQGQTNAALRLAAAIPAQAAQAAVPDFDARIEESQSNATRLLLPLLFKNTPIGILELRDPARGTFSAEAVKLLQPFANAAAVAIENARLYEQARDSATLAERNRLARELHDTIAQGLTAVTMQLEAAQRSFERDPVRTRARLGRAYELARDTLNDVRRSVWTLASPLISGEALAEALEELTQRFSQRTALAATYVHEGNPPALDHAAATQILRMVQEALQNVEKHAQATAVTVESVTHDDALWLCVQDNGKGFDLSEARTNGTTAGSGFGLVSLRERARLAGATVQVESTPGMGTRVEIRVLRKT